MYLFAGPMAFSKSSADTFYVVTPVKGRVLDAWAVGDENSIVAAATITLKKASTAVNAIAFGASYAAGAVKKGTPDVTNAQTVFSADSKITVVLAKAGVASATAQLVIDYDEFARRD